MEKTGITALKSGIGTPIDITATPIVTTTAIRDRRQNIAIGNTTGCTNGTGRVTPGILKSTLMPTDLTGTVMDIRQSITTASITVPTVTTVHIKATGTMSSRWACRSGSRACLSALWSATGIEHRTVLHPVTSAAASSGVLATPLLVF
jgi:hypothetical protein